jgi:hypothetical protein
MKILRSLTSLLIALFLISTVGAQKLAKYSYAAQKKFIPVELGQIYLGMPLKALAVQVDLKAAEADDRFEPLELKVLLNKGNITDISLRIHGLSAEEKEAIVRTETIKKKSDDGFEYDTEVKRLKLDALPAKGFVYAIYIGYKKDFGLKAHLARIFGPGEVRKKDDPYHFYDTEWTKKTPDGLVWLIRAYHEGDGRSLQLLGRIPGTEWAVPIG